MITDFKMTRLVVSILFKGFKKRSLFSVGVEYKRLIFGAFMFFPCLVVANPCQDSFKNQEISLFQKSPETTHQIPSYIENLKAILEDPNTRLSEKKVAVQLLGVLGESQKEFSMQVLSILIQTMHDYKEKEELGSLVIEVSQLISLQFDFTKDVLIKELFILINHPSTEYMVKYHSIVALKKLAQKWSENAVSISEQLLKSRLIPQKVIPQQKQSFSLIRFANKITSTLSQEGTSTSLSGFIKNIKNAVVEIILKSSPDIQKQLIQLLKEFREDSSSSVELQDIVIEIYGEVKTTQLRQDLSPLNQN